MVFPVSVFAGSLAAPPPIPAVEIRSWLGIIMQPLNEDLIEYWNLDADGGIIISSVIEGSPAEEAGLQVADIIIALEGEPLAITKEEDLAGFRRSIELKGVGARTHLTLLREGVRQEVSLQLGLAPVTAWTAEEYEDEDLGLTVREITLNDIQGQNLGQDTEGVVVSELEQAGSMQLAGLLQGDIIQQVDGHAVTDLGSFREQVERLRDEKPRSTVLFVLRQIETLFVAVRTPWK
jgi:serine protease Do